MPFPVRQHNVSQQQATVPPKKQVLLKCTLQAKNMLGTVC